MSSRLVSTTLVLTTQGTKWELRKVEATFSAVVERLNERVFVGKRETFLMHQLKKLLSTEARKELRKNLPDHAAIVYSDYSKGTKNQSHLLFTMFIFWLELALTTPENIKSAAFGASNCTIQLVPQVNTIILIKLLDVGIGTLNCTLHVIKTLF